MALGQVFVSWVKNNYPQIYDKNDLYNSNEGVQTLLFKLNTLLQAKDRECNIAYSDILQGAANKTQKISAFNSFYNDNKNSDTLINDIDKYVTNGTITSAKTSLEFLSDLMFKFNM